MNPALELAALALGLSAGLGGYLLVTRNRGTSPSASSGGRAGWSSRQILLVILWGSVAGALTLIISGIIGLAIAAAFLAGMSSSWIRSRREAARVRQVEGYYPDLIEALIAQVRSGSSLLAAVAAASANAPAAVAIPAHRMWQSVQISGDVSACLDELKAQWASPTGDLLIETIRVAHDVGGNRVVDVLRELADHIRRDRNQRREVEAKQSWVRVAARVGVAAPWVVLVLLSFRAETAAAYNSPAGLTLIVCGLALSVVSYRLMIALGRTPSARRVFSS